MIFHHRITEAVMVVIIW